MKNTRLDPPPAVYDAIVILRKHQYDVRPAVGVRGHLVDGTLRSANFIVEKAARLNAIPNAELPAFMQRRA